ncbi:hypothetical protein [Streptomyces sp. NPDC057702]|uniref:hypothetical protein n=1 Tax=unclassified Streptomyces TaxID=2593676 RepID=UPI00369A03EF
MTRKYGVLTATACVVAVLGLTGCGSESKGDKDKADAGATVPKASQEPTSELSGLTAQQISDKAKNALLGATSLRMKMNQGVGAESMKIDMALDKQGNCNGTIGDGGGASSELIKSGTKVWMKPNQQFWTQPDVAGEKDGAAAAELFKDRYIHGTTDDEMLKANADMCNLAAMQTAMESDGKTKDQLTKGTLTKLGDQLVIPLTGPGEDGGQETMYVAATGTPYPLKIVIKGGSEPGTVELSDYDKPVSTTPPPANEVIDIAKLEQQLGL